LVVADALLAGARPRQGGERQAAGDRLLRQAVDGFDAVEQGEAVAVVLDDGDAARAIRLGNLNKAHVVYRGFVEIMKAMAAKVSGPTGIDMKFTAWSFRLGSI
jgi:hypothetical protein